MTDNDDLNDAAWDEDEDETEGDSETGEVSHAAAGTEPLTDADRKGKRKKQEDYVSTDERANVALKFVSDVIREMEMECTVHLRRPQEGNAEDEINIEIAGRDAGRIIGKKGQVLQALQFLTHRIINRPGSTAATSWSMPRAIAAVATTPSPPWPSASAARPSKKAKSSPSSQ